MPSTSGVKAYKCKVCHGTGKSQSGDKCQYCLGSGYIGNDGTYEYILTPAEGGKFIITDIKLPNPEDSLTDDFNKKGENSQNQNNNPTNQSNITNTDKKNEDWDKKVKNFWITFINVLFIIALLAVSLLNFFVLNQDKALISIGVIILSVFLVFNISRSSVFDKLKEVISKNWNEPRDYLYYLKEKKKKESE